MVVALPGHIINQPCLQKQVSPGQQVVTNQILVGSDCDPIAETEGAQHIQNLQRDTGPQTSGPPGGHRGQDLTAKTHEGSRPPEVGGLETSGRTSPESRVNAATPPSPGIREPCWSLLPLREMKPDSFQPLCPHLSPFPPNYACSL